MIFESIYNVYDRVYSRKEDTNFSVAIHEVGHALFVAEPKERTYDSYDKIIADIKIAMAGNIAEKNYLQ